MRAFVTGATGFIGGRVVEALLARGATVSALARNPAKAAALTERGVAVVEGDITDEQVVRTALAGHDAVFHLAAWYAIGARDEPTMRRINVEGARIVLTAAADAGAATIVHCSTVAALGTNIGGGVGDETNEHHGGFGSIYEQTKYEAHEIAASLARGGAPLVTVMPTATYGVGDHSMIGLLLRIYAKKLLVACPFMETGLSWVHVDDVAAGIVAAAESGSAGDSFVLGGDNETIEGMFRRIAPLTGIRTPKRLPGALVRASKPLGPLMAKVLKTEPGFLDEGLQSLSGSWMFSSAKAERELGYRWRAIEDGIPQTVTALRA